MTEEGAMDMEGPMHGITPAGTKRLMYILEDVVWYTVHATDKTDPGDVEEEVIAKDYDEFIFKESDILKIQEK